MKRKIILSLITISVLSFASCGNSTTEEPETTVPVETTAEATPEPTVTPEPTATPNVETGTVTNEVDTSSIDSVGVDSKIDEGDYVDPTPASGQDTSDEKAYASIADIPKDIYDPDSNLSVTEQLEKLEEPYSKGLITDEQLDTIADQLFNKGNSGGSTNGSTGANGDTYIPAHGNPGTVNDAAPDPNYVPPFADEPDIDSSNVTIN